MADQAGTAEPEITQARQPMAGEAESPGATVTALHAEDGGHQREASRLFAEASRLHREGKLADAVQGYDKAIALHPQYPDAYNNLGVALRGLGRSEAAIACYRRSLSLRPGDAGIYSNLGNALRELGRYNRAAAAHQQAVTLSPQSPVAIFNLGLVLRDLGHLDEAIGCFERALAIRSDYVDCRWERALTLLQKGAYRDGFQEYAWRGMLRARMRRPFEQPVWEGEDLDERTILVHCDQSFSDMVQFARFVPLVAERGGTVIVECPQALQSLFAGLTGVHDTVVAGQALPLFDIHCPLSALPAVFDTTLDQVPGQIPFLNPPPLAAPESMPDATGMLKVGVAWAGDPARRDSPNIDCPLRQLLELAELPGVAFYSLQSGRAARERGTIACDSLIRECGAEHGDAGQLAAITAEMDLIITVDSMVAHVAGSLGRPVWVLLPFVSDWRWLMDREDSPWYPTACLFRQDRHGDWAEVFNRVREALQQASRSAGQRRKAG